MAKPATEPKVVVYQAKNLVNGHTYIGYTGRGLKQREAQHRQTANGRGAPGHYLHNAIRKYGQENFVFEVLFDFLDDEELAKAYECEAIAKYKPEYNISYGGEGGTLPEETRKKIGDANRGRKMPPSHHDKRVAFLTGRKHTDETRAKMSAAQKGHPSNLRGRAVAEETRQKISAANKGRVPWTKGKKHSEETRAKMSAWQIGRQLSVETRQKMSAARRELSKNPSEAMNTAWASNIGKALKARQIQVKCIDDGRVFSGASNADRFYGFRIGLVSRILKGTAKNATGKTFIRCAPEEDQ
jgi:group I intron endonuclease